MTVVRRRRSYEDIRGGISCLSFIGWYRSFWTKWVSLLMVISIAKHLLHASLIIFFFITVHTQTKPLITGHTQLRNKSNGEMSIRSEFRFDRAGNLCRVELTSEMTSMTAIGLDQIERHNLDRMIALFAPEDQRGRYVKSTTLTLNADDKYILGAIQEYENVSIYRVNKAGSGEYVSVGFRNKSCEDSIPRVEVPKFVPSSRDR